MIGTYYVRELEQQLIKECYIECPWGPCINCLRRMSCDSFLGFKKEHPEYDVKYTSYVTAHRELLERLKQRSLCAVEGREQVPQQGRRLGQDNKTKNIIKRRIEKMRLDFSEVKDSVQAPEGIHDFEIIKAEEKTSQNGTHMLVVDAKELETEGFIRDNVCLEGPGAFRAKQFFEALGVEIVDVENYEATDLIGMGFTAEVQIEEYEGKEYSKIKKYIA